ncbi:hypothetical protein M501DRAFT_1006443 [Patellaria atrata CBS 101060]|uniref:Uncharacterized protein n=1 Tax=Patellaria atrata CBS 101060 TaxID=1346257 RepID=A0A9P4VLW3_9PEZI|nr:hypothetical protein M501DRAFT_1006443 [Patellaria atrata CBS 101060]
MDGPPPPPPPHGKNPKSHSGLPPGNYDIFIIPPHSAGSGFLYLPSLQPHRNSFLAGVASTLICVGIWTVIASTVKQWFAVVVASGGVGVLILAAIVGIVGLVVGRMMTGGTDPPKPEGGAGEGARAGPPPGGQRSGYQQRQGSYQGFPGGGPPPHGPPPHGAGPGYGGYNQHDYQSPPEADDPGFDEWEKAQEEQQQRRLDEERKRKEEAERKRKEEELRREEEKRLKEEAERAARAAAEKEKWEKMRAREREKRDREIRERIARERAAREKEAKEREQREREALEAETRARIEKELREKLELEERARKAEQEKRELEEKAEKEKQARERAERLKAARERAERDRAERQKREQEAAAKAAAATTPPPPPPPPPPMAPTASATSATSATSSTPKYGVGERTNPYSRVGTTPSISSASSPRKPTPSANPPSPTKPAYEKPSAKTYVGTEEPHSYRPYDAPKRPYAANASQSSFYSESSYAPSATTARTTPPPSHRGPYSTKDPDKIVLKAVYKFNDLFPNKPIAKLESGSGNVTDGLILKIMTEGLFIDDDVRGVGQREWDIKAWTMKQVETGERHNVHVVRASVRDAGNTKYVFVLEKTEGWKVAVGLQRLRKGSQVRALAVNGLAQGEMTRILTPLGF